MRPGGRWRFEAEYQPGGYRGPGAVVKDPQASWIEHYTALPPGTWHQPFTSYGANQGTFPGTWQQSYGTGEYTQYNGVIYNDSSTRLSKIVDGTSNTFMIGEDVPELNAHNAWCYSNGANSTCAIPPNTGITIPTGGSPGTLGPKDEGTWQDRYSFRSRHAGGLQFALADASVRFVSDSIPLATYRALEPIKGGETVNADQ